jgi:hypothetical protein
MKQQIIELKKKLLLVEFPEGAVAENIRTTCNGNIIYDISHEPQTPKWVYMENKVKASIGKLTGIKEEEYKEFMESLNFSGRTLLYYNYNPNEPCTDFKSVIEAAFKTAKESFFSALEANGIYFENRLGKKPDIKLQDIEKHAAWRNEEKNVWDINRCWLFLCS